MSGIKQRRLRWRLFNLFGKCFHCGKTLVYESENPNQDNIAVLENKYSFWDSLRHKEIHELRWRIVCLSCSRENAKKAQSEVPTEILQDLSHRKHNKKLNGEQNAGNQEQ